MSKIEVDAIDKQSGSTLTIGGSGTTVQLGTGASQTGFGRTGTVDWQTGSIKTATFTAASGEGYFCNTTSSGFTVNLPAGSAGAIVSVQDYNNTFDTNSLEVAPNGSEKINGGEGAITLTTEGQGITLVYIDATVGWRTVQDNDFAAAGSTHITATGGTITTSGNFKIHTFTGPGTFTVCSTSPSAPNNIVDYLVVAGGGGAGATPGNSGGGGGGGGFRYFANPSSNPQSGPGGPRNAPAGITVTATSFPITVGGGGAGGTSASPPAPGGVGTTGSNSVFSTIISAGGGGGGMGTPGSDPNHDGLNGGSGGGGGGGNSVSTGGTGNTPPVSPAQGTNGGGNACGPASPDHQSNGGGGAVVAGQPTQGPVGGNGGNGGGLTGFGSGNGQCSSCVQYFAGGGGAGRNPPTMSSNTTGGLGGGGAPPGSGSATGGAGTTNTGGGGGGGVGPNGNGGAGGSGIVVVRYRFQ